MLFVLDNDIDIAVGRVLRRAGHQCITVASAGMADADDDEVAVFADDHHGVLITHDREFSSRRRRNVFGKHVKLACVDWEAADVLALHLDNVLELLGSRDAVYMRVSKDRVDIYPSKWE